MSERERIRAFHRRKKEESKPESTIVPDEAAARELGLSYGVYMSYKETGYLKTYIRQQKKEQEREKHANVISSLIVGGRGGGTKNREAKKL